jgi:hypothetical protein
MRVGPSRSRRTITTIAIATLLGVAMSSAAPAQAGPTNYQLTYASAPAGQRPMVRWNPCRSISYKVNVTYAATSTAARRLAAYDVRVAMAKIAAATGLTFSYGGSTTEIPRSSGSTSWSSRQRAADIVISWVRQTSSSYRSDLLIRGSVGTGGSVWKIWSNGGPYVAAIGRGFTVLDSAMNSRFRPGFGSGVTRGALLLHEIGHVMGLQHVSTSSELMYPTVLSRRAAAYGSGDLTGLRRVGRSAGCISVPTSVWTSL